MSSEAWGIAGTFVGAVAAVVAAVIAARSTRKAALSTAEAQRVAATVTAEPDQRRADLEAFKAIRHDMQDEIRELRDEQGRMRTLIRAFAAYVSQLTAQMRSNGIEPPAPPPRVEEYNRTGV